MNEQTLLILYLLKTAKKDLVAFVTNLTKKIPGPTNSKERYELLIENKG